MNKLQIPLPDGSLLHLEYTEQFETAVRKSLCVPAEVQLNNEHYRLFMAHVIKEVQSG